MSGPFPAAFGQILSPPFPSFDFIHHSLIPHHNQSCCFNTATVSPILKKLGSDPTDSENLNFHHSITNLFLFSKILLHLNIIPAFMTNSSLLFILTTAWKPSLIKIPNSIHTTNRGFSHISMIVFS